ncbi:hypothetical protein [Streptomyces sp. CH-036]|uniref:hypothetical protein n=1 Tax=Streptomyces sp. CH-036 TaxID=3406733 RepID=UPI003C70A669
MREKRHLLRPARRPPARIIPVTGLVGCLVLAFALPLPSVLTGAALLLIGSAAYSVRQSVGNSRHE